MPDIKLGDNIMTFEEALLASIEIESLQFPTDSQPDLAGLKKWILSKGDKHQKIAKYWTIRSRKSGNIKGHRLTLETIRQTKTHGTVIEDKHTITLNDEDDNEIGILLDALASVSDVKEQGKYIVINPQKQDDNRLRQILDAITKSGRKVDLLAEILSWAEIEPRVSMGLVKLASQNPTRSKSLAAALNYGRYKHDIEELKKLIEKDEQERVYQKFLEENFWMFGSEYSELLSNRTLALGIQLDFPLRRTVDGYLEVVEIKRPMNDEPLFRDDSSHTDLMTRNPKLTNAIDQAGNYLDRLDADRYRIQVQDSLLIEKLRAKVVIGRDYGKPEIIKAIRRINERDLRVEVITYDQLIRIAERILEILGDEVVLKNLEVE